MAAETPVRDLDELRRRWPEARVAGEMRDFCDGLVVIGAVGGTPVILRGAPVILGTPELAEEFTGLWRKACELAGVRTAEVPGGE